ncbi:MAG: glutamate-5-semialdehyde dehydrogenase, partial [Candidatus Omnitrophica bacterium]|nr:glutamate-5-semialdehyde dehydrogenase [Candidatus Omnitrophota bacterium]
MMVLKKKLLKLAESAKCASLALSELSPERKRKILNEVALSLQRSASQIVLANQKDLKLAKKEGLSSAMIDRLTLDRKRMKQMVRAVREVTKLKDPIGQVLKSWTRPNGLKISKVTVPLGVILIIYESRPNVTSECASLCLKSGNAVLLRGGREAFYSNQAIVGIYRKVLKKHGVSQDAVSLIPVLDRRAIDELLKLEDLINLVIPRGGESLIRRVVRKARMPVIKHYQGICHVYVDREADLKMALKIAFNAKCQRPGVCNAMETLLVHRDIARKFLPAYGAMLKEAGCEIRGDEATRRILSGIKAATEKDWRT